MKVRIEIDTKTFVRFWLVVMGFGLAGLAIYSAKDALVLLGISLFLALALNRPVVAIAKKIAWKKSIRRHGAGVHDAGFAFGLCDLVCDSANCPTICQICREHSEYNRPSQLTVAWRQ